MLWGIKLVTSLVVFNSELEHVQNMAIKNAPENEIIWPLFLVTSDGEQRAIVLNTRSLNYWGVFKRKHIVRLFHKQLGHITAAHQVQLSKQLVYWFAWLFAFHYNRTLDVLHYLGRTLFNNLSSFVGLGFLTDSEWLCSYPKLIGWFNMHLAFFRVKSLFLYLFHHLSIIIK